MSLSTFTGGDDEKAISTPLYAPNNSGFTHTSGDQFTYFSGSKSASRSTFGMKVNVGWIRRFLP